MAIKQSQAEIYKIRYQLYRDLGYSPQEARRLRSHALDVSNININPKTKKIRKQSKNYKEKLGFIAVDKYRLETNKKKNDTTYTRWGMLTQDERYKHDTAEVVDYIKKDLGITTPQAYYFLYIQMQGNMTYEETKKTLVTDEEFEIYIPSKYRKKKYKNPKYSGKKGSK